MNQGKVTKSAGQEDLKETAQTADEKAACASTSWRTPPPLD
jgi:hypothetical protein